MRRALLTIAAAALAGCIELRASPPTTVALHLHGRGAVACNLMGVHGCAPLLVIEPEGGGRNGEPTEDDPFFETGGPIDGSQSVTNRVRNAPQALAPGEYRLVGWIAEVNDMDAPPGQTMDLWVSATRGCETRLEVPDDAVRVDVTVTYAIDGCTIEVDVTRSP